MSSEETESKQSETFWFGEKKCDNFLRNPVKSRESFDFQLLSQDDNPGIEFEYSLQSGSVKETAEGGDHYDWLAGDWSQCSGGCSNDVPVRTRSVVCTNIETREVVSDALCSAGPEKPLAEDECQDQEASCLPQWATGEWSNCTDVPSLEKVITQF